jgi:RNA polymerase sigma-B factor
MVDQEHARPSTHLTLPTGDRTKENVTEHLLAEFIETRDPKLRDLLARRFDRVVQWLANKYACGNVATDDLLQMGRIGLLQALDRYDPERGVKFITYAISMIVGEIKHYFRDCAWGLRAPRPLRELYAALPHVEETLYSRLGRSPTLMEMAEHMGVTEERIAAAMELGSAYQPQSLNAYQVFEDWETNEELQDLLGSTDERIDAVVEYEPLHRAMMMLDKRKRGIVLRRYFEEWSQTEVARELGISQMHVSRLEREALEQLRRVLGAELELRT